MLGSDALQNRSVTRISKKENGRANWYGWLITLTAFEILHYTP